MKQIEFPGLQGHSKGFEMAMLAISIICAIVVLVIVLGTLPLGLEAHERLLVRVALGVERGDGIAGIPHQALTI